MIRGGRDKDDGVRTIAPLKCKRSHHITRVLCVNQLPLSHTRARWMAPDTNGKVVGESYCISRPKYANRKCSTFYYLRVELSKLIVSRHKDSIKREPAMFEAVSCCSGWIRRILPQRIILRAVRNKASYLLQVKSASHKKWTEKIKKRALTSHRKSNECSSEHW